MQCETLLISEVVTFVVRNEVDDCPVRQGRRFVQDQTTLLDVPLPIAAGIERAADQVGPPVWRTALDPALSSLALTPQP